MMLAIRRSALVLLSLLGLSWASAAAGPVAVPTALAKAVPKIDAAFDPPSAQPGQTVTWRLTLDVAPGWHVYPAQQPEKDAEKSVTQFTFPAAGDVAFTGTVRESGNAAVKLADETDPFNRYRVRILQGKVVFERSATVKADARPGDRAIPVSVKIQACNEQNCLPAISVDTAAVLEVTPGKATPGGTAKRDVYTDKLAKLIDIKAEVKPTEARPGEVVKLTLTGTLKPGYHTYPITKRTKGQEQLTEISYQPGPGLKPLWPVTESPGEFKKEEGVGVILEHVGKVTWSQDVLVLPDAAPGPHTLGINIKLQVCDDKGCIGPGYYPELTATVNVKGEPVALSDALKKRLGEGPPPVQEVAPPAGGQGGAVARAERARNNIDLLSFLLTGAIMGIVSLFTPCVFPMIPITVSFFIKQSERRPAPGPAGPPAHHSALTLALVYSGTIVVVLTVGAMLLLGFFQAATQFWLTNLILAALFVVFALSLFGMYEITLPTGLANYTSSQQGRGGLAGTVFMALTFAIISFSCVAPFLGGFAALVPSFGDVIAMLKAGDFGLLGGLLGTLLLGALAFSVCFAAPFFFLALFPSLL
ncbi:MAG TPA: hypothetical protein VFA26_18795, partial [Gemmataceae bacterium]|nr:hypothetical protein [Gemmataceae bacterium]